MPIHNNILNNQIFISSRLTSIASKYHIHIIKQLSHIILYIREIIVHMSPVPHSRDHITLKQILEANEFYTVTVTVWWCYSFNIDNIGGN